MKEDFVPKFSIFDLKPEEPDILEPVFEDGVKRRKVKVKPILRVPCYIKNQFCCFPTTVDSRIKAAVPEFTMDRDAFQNEIRYGSKDYQIFQEFMLAHVEEKFRRESKAIKDAMAMPFIALRSIFLNNNIQRSVFTEKTFLSDATYDRIMKNSDYVPDLKTLTNICWTFKVDYIVAEDIFKAYGYYLDAKTPQIRAYKYVLKYMTFIDIETVNEFLKKNNVPYFQKIPE